MTRLLGVAALALMLPGITLASDQAAQTIIYDGKVTQLRGVEITPKGLWITTKDLKLATGFYIKPKGICRAELCFPIPAKRKTEFISKRKAVTWFNLTEFAALIKQPVARDEKNAVWYFGPRAQAHEGYIDSLEAPDFTLPDAAGKLHSLSSFRGKKVMLVTWASW
jgi:hypothetical protein